MRDCDTCCFACIHCIQYPLHPMRLLSLATPVLKKVGQIWPDTQGNLALREYSTSWCWTRYSSKIPRKFLEILEKLSKSSKIFRNSNIFDIRRKASGTHPLHYPTQHTIMRSTSKQQYIYSLWTKSTTWYLYSPTPGRRISLSYNNKGDPYTFKGRGRSSIISPARSSSLIFFERSFLHCLFAGETKRKQEGGGGVIEEWGSETLTISDTRNSCRITSMSEDTSWVQSYVWVHILSFFFLRKLK